MAKKVNAVLVALIAAVNDLNKVLGFAEPIKTEGATVETLETEIRGVFTEIKPGDKFTPETWEQVKRLGYVTEATPPPPASKKVKAPAAKAEPKAKSPAKEKGEPKAKKEPGEPSNKQRVYKEWKAGTKDPEKLLKVVAGAVKDVTIKSWLSAWGKGNNLPKGA